MDKSIAILGASGSVGSQALSVSAARGYKLDFISGGANVVAIESAVRRFNPRYVAMSDERAARELKSSVADTGTTVLFGSDGILEGLDRTNADTVVNAITGMAGLAPTLAAIKRGVRLALANKESLVIAGEHVMAEAKAHGVDIIPVDSEHSAIFQSMKAGRREEVKKILLTASGGPFFGRTREELKQVTREDALAHPTWKMGKKITVDSATLMNKGFEIIEAAHLFGVGAEKIEVLVHRESILHSAVEYVDNAVIGEFSVPDMQSCIQYAVDYPARHDAVIKPLDLTAIGTLSFHKPDTKSFPLLSLAKRAIQDGGAMGAVLNALDEMAVADFLAGKIGFTDISDVVVSLYERMIYAKDYSDISDIFRLDKEAREIYSKEK